MILKKDDIWWFIIDVPLKSLLLLGDAPDSQTDLFINPTLGESWKKWNMALSKRRGQSSLQFLNFNVEEMFPCSNATMGKKHRATNPPVDQSEGQVLPPLFRIPRTKYIHIYIYIFTHSHRPIFEKKTLQNIYNSKYNYNYNYSYKRLQVYI